MKKIYLAVIYICLALAVDLAVTEKVLAQTPAATPAAAQAAGSGTPVVVTPATVAAPAEVAIPEPAAPPAWATDLLVTASKLPIIGPLLSKALLYLGILAAILTTLVAAALSILSALSSVFTMSGLTTAANAILAFKNGKIMYYLTYFSNFNVQKPTA
jgi:hypothetical protein